MQCPSCGRENRVGIRFCEGCGEPLAVAAGQFCPACGARNRPGIRFCESCGETLVGGAKSVPRRSPVVSQVRGFLVVLVGMLLISILMTVAIWSVLALIMASVSAPAQHAITEEQTIERANLYVAGQYPIFMATQPTVTLALDGEREVYAVGYTRGSAATPDDPLTTLVVLVDAETGETELLAPGPSR